MAAILALSALTTTIFTGCASAPPRPANIALNDYDAIKPYIAQLIRLQMQKHDVTGLSIALVEDQKVVWAEGFGYADKANNIAATAETTYRVGSITKLFTATAALQLADQGRLYIDQSIHKYLPQFAIKGRFADTTPITLRMLMTHHSGLPSDFQRGMWMEKPEPFTNLAGKMKDDYVAYPPNFVMSYSNLGVTLLGHAVQQAAGEDYASYVERTLLRPLGMSHSVLSVRPEAPLMSKGYRKGAEAVEVPLRDVPAGGLNSSVLDLSHFLQMVFADGRYGQQQILKPETLAEMLRPQNGNVPLDRDFSIGLGWMLTPLKGVRREDSGPVARHNGATVLHRSELIALPKHKLGVVVLANSSSAGNVVGKVATETLKLALEAKTGIKPDDKNTPTENESMVAAGDPKAFAGHYASAIGFATISGTGSTLRAEALGKSFDLVARSDGRLSMQYRLLGMVPISLPGLSEIGLSRDRISGREVLLANIEGQSMLVGEKLVPVPVSQKWMARQGDYEILNADGAAFRPDKITLRYRDDFLVVETLVRDLNAERISMAVMPVSDTELIVLGLGRQMGETIRIATINGEERVLYSGYILRKTVD
jgi:CubicO group peptidase (beta-lactamase class C family)